MHLKKSVQRLAAQNATNHNHCSMHNNGIERMLACALLVL